MAKVKSPLMSFSASGQIGKSLVFATWKGIADVRQYVVPANPKSAGQVSQRGLLTSAVSSWHQVVKNIYDAAAYNILASLESKPMSGFNVYCKQWIASLRVPESVLPVSGFIIVTNTGGSLSFSVSTMTGLVVFQQIGLSPSVLGGQNVMTEVGTTGVYNFVGATVVAGNDYYIKIGTSTAGTKLVSGIYKVRALA